MQSRRSQIALLVLLTFVVGSIVAPASHYAFMLFSDAYGVGGHLQHSTEHASHGSAHDGAHGSAHHSSTPIASPHEMPVQARDAGVDHFYCEYAALFATFAATGPLTVFVADVTPVSSTVIALADLAPAISIPAAFQQRGPPVPV